MTQQNDLQQVLFSRSLGKRGLQGAALAFLLVMILVLTGPGLDENWVLIPISLVTIGGACGAIFYHVADYMRQQRGWSKIWINILCTLVYIAGLYLSLVYALSLVGLWD
jgi:hypothetical protein